MSSTATAAAPTATSTTTSTARWKGSAAAPLPRLTKRAKKDSGVDEKLTEKPVSNNNDFATSTTARNPEEETPTSSNAAAPSNSENPTGECAVFEGTTTFTFLIFAVPSLFLRVFMQTNPLIYPRTGQLNNLNFSFDFLFSPFLLSTFDSNYANKLIC